MLFQKLYSTVYSTVAHFTRFWGTDFRAKDGYKVEYALTMCYNMDIIELD